jgi:hypothetical protein
MNKVEKIKAYLERRIAEIRDISQGYIADKKMSTEYLLLHELLSFIDSIPDTEKDFGIKESVIPFGASDSELIEATYFIPQGYHAVIDGNRVIIKKGEGPVSNDLEEAAHSYVDTTIEWFDSEGNPCCYPAFIAGAQWQKENLWKDAQGDDLPEIDRDVVVLVKSFPEHEDSLLKVSFAHRPPEYWEGKNIGTGEITRYEPMRYDKGQWSKPAVVWWLDVELPKEEE